MKKQRTALSVRAHRRRKRMSYEALEAKQLLAADVIAANSPNVCELDTPTVEAVAQLERSTPETDSALAQTKNFDAIDKVFSRSSVSVSEIIVDDGTASRSMVRSITLVFDGIVDPQSEAFELIQRESGTAVELKMTVDNSSGVSHVRLTFSGEMALRGGSLVDGNYQLNVTGELLGSSSGAADFTFGGEANDNLYRFFGDFKSNRTVDVFDLLYFRKTYQLNEGDEGFEDQFDENANGTINAIDLLFLRSNFDETLDFA